MNKPSIWLHGLKLSTLKWIHKCLYLPWWLICSCEPLRHLSLGIENLPFFHYSILTLTLKSVNCKMNIKPSCKEDSGLASRFCSSSPPETFDFLASCSKYPIFFWTYFIWCKIVDICNSSVITCVLFPRSHWVTEIELCNNKKHGKEIMQNNYWNQRKWQLCGLQACRLQVYLCKCLSC